MTVFKRDIGVFTQSQWSYPDVYSNMLYALQEMEEHIERSNSWGLALYLGLTVAEPNKCAYPIRNQKIVPRTDWRKNVIHMAAHQLFDGLYNSLPRKFDYIEACVKVITVDKFGHETNSAGTPASHTRCECGTDAAGGGKHSSYCPKGNQ